MFISGGVQYKSRKEFELLHLRTDPVSLGDSLPVAASKLQEQPPSLVHRLRTKLGLGDDPKKRMALYLRLQMMHEAKPEIVEMAVRQVWSAAATSARDPGRYFCASILRRLAELGVVIGKDGVDHGTI
jgi:hypothetical protein